MMPVLGMGGIFFRAADPDALTAWYRDTLGVGAGCDATGTDTADGDTADGDAAGGDAAGGDAANKWFWQVQGGPMVFAPFEAKTDYFPADKAFMLNLRVSEIDAMIAALTEAGVAVETRAEWDSPETGRFARIHDPEGNPIELWEPPAG